jgi:sulfite exporter TauE/SafE
MTPELVATLAAAALLGLLGAGHCFAMCGGIVAALSFAAPANAPRWRLNLGYSTGRLFSYALFGGLAAGLVAVLPPTGWPLARTLAGLLLIAMGLYLANWWHGLLWLERGGRWLWRGLKPVGDRFLPLDSISKALLVGMVWGWLPCGLVYAALGYAAAQAEPLKGAAVMLAFGVGTLPALLAGGVLAAVLKTWFSRPRIRLMMAIAYILFGAWTLVGAWSHALFHQTDHAHHHH